MDVIYTEKYNIFSLYSRDDFIEVVFDDDPSKIIIKFPKSQYMIDIYIDHQTKFYNVWLLLCKLFETPESNKVFIKKLHEKILLLITNASSDRLYKYYYTFYNNKNKWPIEYYNTTLGYFNANYIKTNTI